MATIAENLFKWTDHPWRLDGHEWSPGGTPAGTEMLWWHSLRPRLHALLPSDVMLEIAPGFGRWTHYLLRESRQVIGVDATARCVEVCRERFAGRPAQFWANDGRALPMLADASVDGIFSFDSLVHVEAPEIASYLNEAARCLKPGGMGFFHHSNLGAYADPSSRAIPRYVTRKGWRAPSMSARLFRQTCRAAGLECLTQEMITWRIRGKRPYRLPGEQLPLSDCFSIFCKPPRAGASEPTMVYVNRDFVREWDHVTVLGELYCPDEFRGAPKDDHVPASGAGPPAQAWRTMRARVARQLLARREPVMKPLQSGRCPDCGRKLLRLDAAARCDACRVAFIAA